MLRSVTTVILTGFLCFGSAATAMAASNPSPTGTGPPNQSCQAFEGPGGTNAPGNSGTSPGSVFNEPGFGSTNGGTGGHPPHKSGAAPPHDRLRLHVHPPPPSASALVLAARLPRDH